MKFNLTVAPSHPDDVYALSGALCYSDRLHLRAVFDPDAPDGHRGEMLAQSIEDSYQSFTISDDENRILGMWGHSHWEPVLNIGRIWMLSTDELFAKHLRELTVLFRREILPALADHYDALSAVVRSKNHGLMRWLIGANFITTYGNTLGGEDFTLLTLDSNP
jgi:hypothetical protein